MSFFVCREHNMVSIIVLILLCIEILMDDRRSCKFAFWKNVDTIQMPLINLNSYYGKKKKKDIQSTSHGWANQSMLCVVYVCTVFMYAKDYNFMFLIIYHYSFEYMHAQCPLCIPRRLVLSGPAQIDTVRQFHSLIISYILYYYWLCLVTI